MSSALHTASVTRVSFVSLLTHILVILSWTVTWVSGSQCKLLSMYGKKTADCDNLNLKSIPKDLEHDVQVLLFRDNRLTYLGMDEFTNYRAIQELRLVRNKIEMIAPDAFRYLYNVQILDLEGNKLTNIPATVFQHLTSVRIVNMKSNPLVILTKDALSHLKNVEELNFENCWLERIHPQAFKGLNSLHELNLVNNELMVLDAEMERYLPMSLNVMRMHRNPWNCDCKLRWLREYVNNRKIQWNFYTNVPVCNKPELIHDIAWDNLSPKKFACAPQIIASGNASTSIELEVQGNVTIKCVVQGDPKPDITWMTGSKFVPSDMINQKTCVSDDGTMQICSSLTFKDLRLEDEGDYRCIAKNIAGQSEKTYKLWVHDPMGSGAATTLYGLTTETLIGIGIGAVVLVLLVVACIIWMVKRQNGSRKPAYKVRDYKKPARNNHENHSPSKMDKECYEVEEEAQPVISEVKEKDKTTHIPVNCELEPINHKPAEAPKVPSPVIENNLNAAKNNEFKMTIFKPEQKTEDKSNLDKTVTTIDGVDKTEVAPLCNNKPGKSGKKPEPICVDMNVPPDVVQRPDDSRKFTHNRSPSPPPPAVTTGNHIQGHKRAQENPYAKPSDMKPNKPNKSTHKSDKKTSDEHKQKPDNPCIKGLPVEYIKNDPKKTKEDIYSPTTSSDSGSEKRKVTTFSVEPASPSSCKNPVCLKEHPSDLPRSKSPTKNKDLSDKDLPPPLSAKQHIKGSKSMGGLNNSPERARHSGTISPPSSKTLSPADRYKTLPSRPKLTTQTDNSQPYGTYVKGRSIPPHEDYNIPSSRLPQGHYDVPRGSAELPRPMKTATIASPRQLPPMVRSSFHEPQIHGFQPSLPPGPLPTHLRSKTLTPRSRTSTGSHGDRPTSSPTRKLPKAFEATSLDDLLSPPFGHITVDKQKSPRTQVHKLPKPGDKDEYGTAV